MRIHRRLFVAVAAGATLALTLTACGSGTDTGGGATTGSGKTVLVGTTDKVTSLDPAGAYDNGSFNVEYQVYRFVLGFAPGDPTPKPDAAEKCEFTDPKTFTCTIKKDLKFANGNPLDANAIKFTYDRMMKIKDPNGPSSLLANLVSTDAPDANTVVFNLKDPNDQTFAQALASPAGPIVDPKTFSADALTPDQDIVKGNGFSGPYTIKTWELNQTVEFSVNDSYNGVQGKPANSGVILKYYTDPTNMRLEIAQGTIDVATRSLTPTDVDTLKKTDGVKVYTGPGGEIRYIVFNMKTMPGGTDDQKLAVRKAMASLIDRQKLSTQVYKETYTPLYSMVPDGQLGATQAFKDTYGDKPNVEEAKKFLTDAGVATPVTVALQYNPDHYGTSSADEYNEIKTQLENGGLFKINLQSTEWVTYNKERVKDTYPVYQLGWFPDFPDADNYITPFFMPDNFLENHFENADLTAQIDKERTAGDATEREAILGQIQKDLAEKYVPTLPLLQGSQVAIGRDGVTGIEKTLDASFQFRFVTLSKG